MSVLIIGGGWAGLAASIELSRHNIPVTVIEANKQLGGRARTVQYRDKTSDNGQHLMVGAYHDLLKLIDIMGLKEADLFQRFNLKLVMRSPHDRTITLNLPKLPAPFHLLAGVAMAKGYNIKERFSIMRFMLRVAIIQMKNSPFKKGDYSVATLLKDSHQSPRLIQSFWEPLCLAMLNTPIEQASAQVYCRVLDDLFSNKRSDADLLLASDHLGETIPHHAKQFIEKNGGKIITGKRVKEILIKNNQTQGVRLSNDSTLHADHVILATAANSALKLCQPHDNLAPLTKRLKQLSHSPICTVYLQYPKTIKLNEPILGLYGTTAQWVFDRRINQQPGLMAVVVSSHGDHMALNNDELSQKVGRELTTLFNWPKPDSAYVIREKRATFLCETGIEAIRPDHQTTVNNLLIAGDYTQTDYPATLEGAVRSGLQCARVIIQN